VKPVSSDSFGLLIAYLIPGYTALWGLSYFSDSLNVWMGITSPDAPTLGGFLYTTVAAVAAGMTVSTVRWAVLDTMHHRTGIRSPRWDFSLLGPNVEAFQMLVEIHYKYYLFYSNSCVALLWSYGLRRWAIGWAAPIGGLDLLIPALMILFYLASRDSLRRYYQRSGQLLCWQQTRQNRKRRANPKS
jgi:hypothetical protein